MYLILIGYVIKFVVTENQHWLDRVMQKIFFKEKISYVTIFASTKSSNNHTEINFVYKKLQNTFQ